MNGAYLLVFCLGVVTTLVVELIIESNRVSREGTR